jgi:glutamate racemase
VSDQAIGLFDSGVGGLSVFRELSGELPHENIIYFADTLHMPYGSRTPEELRQLVFAILDFLVRQKTKLVIMACNTSSSWTLELARQHFTVPILGMIEPTAVALASDYSRRLGIIGTEATIRSHKYQQELEKAGFVGQVYNQACPELASLIESGANDAVLQQAIGECLLPLKQANVEQVVLGCTHYPFAAKLIQDVLGDSTTLVNPATFVVQEAKQLLRETHLLNASVEAPVYRFYTSGNVVLFEGRADMLLGRHIQARQAYFRTTGGILSVEDCQG